MINIKYLILLCVTLYTPTVNSLVGEEIDNLWNKIRTEENNYILYENFVDYYKGQEKNEFLDIIQYFGTKCPYCGVTRMSYDQFKNAASNGFIAMNSIFLIRKLFDSIAKKEKALFVTMKNLHDYYGPDIEYYSIEIVKTFGVSPDGEWKLYFDGFKRVLNFGLLDGPCDEDYGSPYDGPYD